MTTALKIAVLGSAGEPPDSSAGRKARQIGRLAALSRAVLLTGGCTGLPHAAAMGAASAGGITVAVSPAISLTDHRERYGYPVDSHVILYTGMGTKGRNVVLVRSADACIFVGGGMGTLNEFTIAFDELDASCVIGVLTGSGGLSDEFPRLAASAVRKSAAALLMNPDPARLMDGVLGFLKASPGWR